ncbi:Mariner Mos1 transposase [Eumeta japonica]|uniref:Mariner Mos1 transposase n=1 Tax=Eumeta variegata TaxID=151549 RepID=A0A4C1XH64_EUMVA|nr:Mariner Mos1 transposase [Eumeta japonica]
MLLARHKKFLHRIVTGDEKWIHYDNRKEENHGTTWPRDNIDSKTEYSWKKLMLCIWWDQLGVVYYELLNPSETIIGTLYRIRLMRLTRALKEKRPQYYSRHDKIILPHDNARPRVAVPVKKYLKALDWEVLPHPPYSPDIAPSDYHLFRPMAHALSEQRFTSYEDTKNWVDSWIASKDKEFFRLGIRTLPEK